MRGEKDQPPDPTSFRTDIWWSKDSSILQIDVSLIPHFPSFSCIFSLAPKRVELKAREGAKETTEGWEK